MEFANDRQKDNYREVLRGLTGLGYSSDLLREKYTYSDWFSPTNPVRNIAAATFGQTPVSYETACFGVALSNGVAGQELMMQCRALGSPVVFEITPDVVCKWGIGKNSSALLEEIKPEDISNHFSKNAEHWTPQEFLRAKDIGKFTWQRQLELFSGLLPELESEIQSKLDPMLRSALSKATQVYQDETGRVPDEGKLFQLTFWLLTGKVFHDREVNGFKRLSSSSGADEVLKLVAKHYRPSIPSKLLTSKTREEVFRRIWLEMDFRNLSVNVLSQIWATTLVDDEIKKKLGIHRTSRSIVRYVVDRTPFESVGDERLLIFEPCCGSAGFLVAAMNRLRAMLWGQSSEDRHKYFTKHISGIEKDPFGAELSKLSLTLADFPNVNGWDVETSDVFTEDQSFSDRLKRCGIVFCNPPFEDFSASEREKYSITSVSKPAEILERILNDLHPHGVLGFVLPRSFIDGKRYKSVRRRLADRFSKIEITELPDKAFAADTEIALLVAHAPLPHVNVEVTHRKVIDTPADWKAFHASHLVSSEEKKTKTIDEIEVGLGIPELSDVWEFLGHLNPLGSIAEIHRGIEWNKSLTEKKDGKTVKTNWLKVLCQDAHFKGSVRGIGPRDISGDYWIYQAPRACWLDVSEEHGRGNARLRNWGSAKVIMNSKTRSRGPWRISAFEDYDGLACYQTFTGVWLEDESKLALVCAVLNSPVANAFVATREGKTDLTIEVLSQIPIPVFSAHDEESIRGLIDEYIGELKNETGNPDSTLRRIDALILNAYRLPPKLERKLLDFFNDRDGRPNKRPTPFQFDDYFPRDFEPCFSLHEWITKMPHKSTVERFRNQDRDNLAGHIRQALAEEGVE